MRSLYAADFPIPIDRSVDAGVVLVTLLLSGCVRRSSGFLSGTFYWEGWRLPEEAEVGRTYLTKSVLFHSQRLENTFHFILQKVGIRTPNQLTYLRLVGL
jgi:hypothetical protein